MSKAHSQFEEKCKKTVEHFNKDMSRMRTGRASGALVDSLGVDYYGSSVPLQQLAMIATPEPRCITIQPYDPASLEAIEKALQQSELGLNPSREGAMLRLVIPALTEERRKELIKKLHKLAEDARIAIRNNRREVLDILKKQEKDKEISQDDHRRAQEEVQKVTDKYVKEIDVVLSVKEKEMMEV